MDPRVSEDGSPSELSVIAILLPVKSVTEVSRPALSYPKETVSLVAQVFDGSG